MKVDEEAEKIVQKIIDEKNIDKEEITEKIEEKQEELSGFITPEGAATIVARNYGVTPEREEPEVRKLLIDDLSEGMSNVDIVGRVSRTFEPKEFDRKDGSKGKVANVVLMDKTGEIRVALWGKMTNLVSEGEIQKGIPLRIERAYIKKGYRGSPELNVGGRSEIEIHPDDERVEDLPEISDTVKISELDTSSEYADLVGRVTAVTSPREFERSDKSTGKVATLRIIDETGQCRISLWGDKADKVEKINQGDAVRIENASVREGRQDNPELHLNWRGRIILNPSGEEIENLPEFEKKLLKIEEVEPDMPALNLTAKVQRTFNPQDFERDDGSTGRVMNVSLADETGTIRASLWGDMVDIGEKLSPGDTVLLENARSAVGLRDRPEIRVGRRTNVEINPEGVEIQKMKPSQVKMSEIKEGLDSLEVVGRVTDITEPKEFTRSDDTEGKVGSLTLGDETGTSEVTLWGDKTRALNEIEKGTIIKITDAYTVPGNYGGPEIHVGDQATVEVNPSISETIPPAEEIGKGLSEQGCTSVADVEENMQTKIKGTIVRVFERNPVFEVCPNCGRNLSGEESETMCEKCGEVVEPDYRAVINMIVDDGSDNIRAVGFGKLSEELFGKTAEEISNSLSQGADVSEVYDELDLEGREIIISGGVKRDEYYDQLEIRARDIDFPDPISEAEKILEKIES